VRNRYGALLKGLLFCTACDRAMVHTFTGRGVKQYRYYTCTHAIKSGRSRCPSGSLPAAEIERAVVEQVRCIGRDSRLRAEVLKQARTHVERALVDLQSNRRGLARELARHHAEINRLAIETPANGAATARIADLHERVAKAETQLAEWTKQVEEAERERLEAEDVATAFADFDDVWNALSPREQAQVLALLVSRVEFNAEDSTVAVTFHPSGIRSLAESRHEEAA
jgi:site-specific DNA recombinase